MTLKYWTITPEYEADHPEVEARNETIIGAYPNLTGEWDGESWIMTVAEGATSEKAGEEIKFLRELGWYSIEETELTSDVLTEIVSDLDPEWAISHVSDDDDEAEDMVISEVYEWTIGNRDIYIFGYSIDFSTFSDGFYEAEYADKCPPMMARQYAMNGGGDIAVYNDIPWNPLWLEWIERGIVT